MRKLLIAGTWKMSLTLKESVNLARALKKKLKNVKNDKEILICPSFIALKSVSDVIKGSNINLGAQDVFYENKGNFTGEISALNLKELNCKYVIIGHSERRHNLNETNDTINLKIKNSVKNKLNAILCVGETKEQKNKNLTKKVIKEQVKGGLKNINSKDMKKIVIAYEPSWAISGGNKKIKASSAIYAENIHKYIRKLISDIYSIKTANEIRIIYGGSIKPDNIKELIKENNIDGGLVGNSSLNAESFSKIIKI